MNISLYSFPNLKTSPLLSTCGRASLAHFSSMVWRNRNILGDASTRRRSHTCHPQERFTNWRRKRGKETRQRMRSLSSPSHLDRIMTGKAVLFVLVTDNNEGPAVLVKCHCSGYSSHLDDLAWSQTDRLLPHETTVLSNANGFPDGVLHYNRKSFNATGTTLSWRNEFAHAWLRSFRLVPSVTYTVCYNKGCRENPRGEWVEMLSISI